MDELAPRPSLHDWPFHGLMSLWDIMRKISAAEYVELGRHLTLVESVLTFTEPWPDDPGRPLTDEETKDIVATMVRMQRVAAAISLPVTLGLLKKRVTNHPKTTSEIKALSEALQLELSSRLFLAVPEERAQFYERNDLMSEHARAQFPNLSQELRHAANCYALGQPTACVFHCMRALEHALGALARDVGLTWTKEQWHTIIEQIVSRIESDRGGLPRGPEKDERLNFLSQAAKEFFYFKDGWRNYVAHNKVSYEAPQALQPWNTRVPLLSFLRPDSGRAFTTTARPRSLGDLG